MSPSKANCMDALIWSHNDSCFFILVGSAGTSHQTKAKCKHTTDFVWPSFIVYEAMLFIIDVTICQVIIPF